MLVACCVANPLSLPSGIKMLIDTHIHLYAEEFDADRDHLVQKALNAGVGKFLLPNIDPESVEGMFQLCENFPDHCFPMMGLHPCYVKEDYVDQLKTIKSHLEKKQAKIIAIGEIGLDFHWDLTFKSEQEIVFREQVLWAHELNLPIAIHSRNSTNEIIKILHELNLKNLKGVFHCFSGDINQADEILNMGFYFGIGGVVTFKNSGLDKIVADLPMSAIILETDGPYLAPTPYRGKRNEPSYLKLVAEKLAEIKGLTLEEIGKITTQNAVKLFKLPAT
ncbi:MAG TPA: TatD family hydrolase [Bacteroidia bacterium]|nr:TatD family hydrolase [Bacteroidia bacterium]